MDCPKCQKQHREMEIQYVCERCGHRQWCADDPFFTLDQIEAWMKWHNKKVKSSLSQYDLRTPEYGLAKFVEKGGEG